jgi:hypothetical protein
VPDRWLNQSVIPVVVMSDMRGTHATAAFVVLLAVLAVGCTHGSVTASDSASPTQRPTPSSSTQPISTPSASSSPTQSADARGGEAIASLPDVGTLSWDCSRKAGTHDFKFSTTFSATAASATQTVEYSLNGSAWVTKVLQPGMVFSTPFVKATSHTWRIAQSIEPYTTKVTIVVTLIGNSFGDCLNPEVDVSRVRISHGAP